ncbi:MAG: hypothetical protein K6F99_06625 [Lachnospiraceae bacterium]|nr:hypothetical protein [Lachnospiraceae bacterium]
MTEENERIIKAEKLYKVIFILQIPVAPVLLALVYLIKGETDTTKLISVCLFAFIISFIHCATQFKGLEGFLYDNKLHPLRELVCFICFETVCVFGGLLPEFTLPISGMSLIFLHVTSPLSAVASAVLFTISAMLSSGDYGLYCVYYLVCTFWLFVLLDTLKGKRGLISAITTFVMLRVAFFCVISVMMGRIGEPEILFAVFFGLVADIVTIMVGIFRIRRRLVNRARDVFYEINDPEHSLLLKLKEEDKYEYLRAIHTAHLSFICAKRLDINRDYTRALGFYHRIGAIRGKNDNLGLKSVSILTQNKFPLSVVKLVREYSDIGVNELSKECVVVILCDEVVHSIMDKFKNDPEWDKNTEKVIDDIFKEKFDSDIFRRADVSFREWDDIRGILKKEKLYYDLLR